MTLSSLTKSQKEAIDHFEGPLLIIAGPGAGKTSVLVERVLSLINNRNVEPDNILLTTFTNKAADELRARISKEIGDKAEVLQISTIHSFCKRLLEQYSDFHNFGATFDVLSKDRQIMFLQNNYEVLGINKHRIHDYMEFYNQCGENKIDPDELITEIQESYPHNRKYPKICQSYKDYLQLLEENNKIDFAGLQKYALKLLKENPNVLEELRERYQFILVDEYQDTNPIQDKIFELIAFPKCNICVVGDDDQSIYSFRGANIDNFLRFPKKYKNAHIVSLKKNFRSTSNIIEVSEDFINGHRKIKKDIEPDRNKGNGIVLLKSENDEDEAKKVVKLIQEMKRSKIIHDYGYVTLLFRSVKNHAGKIVDELQSQKIPYEIRGDGTFLKREEIRTMLYLLAYVDSPNYDKKFRNKWKNWWNLSLFGNEFLNLSSTTHNALQGLEKEYIDAFLESTDFKAEGIENEEDISKLLQLNELKEELKNSKKSILSIFYDIIKISGYLNWLIEEGSGKSDEKLFNLAKLSSIINKYEDITENPQIEDFLLFLYNLPKKYSYDAEILEDPQALKIMTVHQAKGLEFPVVIVCSVVKRKFPMPPRRDIKLVPIPKKLLAYGDEKVTDEERRLFYVAMTRAQDNLIISTSDKTKIGNDSYSPFITEDIGFEKFSDINALIEDCKEREVIKNPSRISYSSVNAYKNCPFMYKMTYFYFFEFMSTHQQKYGTVIHNCLNKLHMSIKNEREISEESIGEIVDFCWIDMYKTKLENNRTKQKLKTKLCEYYRSIKNHIKEIVSTEEPFSLYTGGMLIGGRTDLIFVNTNGETELVDFKAREEAGIEETHVEMQLKVYEYGLNGKYTFDKLCAYLFEENKKSYFEPNGGNMDDIGEDIRNICQKIEMRDFKPHKSGICSQCYFKFCCG